jgi:hypothetical protein
MLEEKVTDEMISAGVEAIGGFELLDAWEGYLDKAELVRKIYLNMAACKGEKV